MKWWKSTAKAKQEAVHLDSDRRREPRIGGTFKVRYSGSEGNDIIIGHGTITDLSRYGFRIQGNQHVQVGMELGLFLELPDRDSPLCIPQATVSWVNGRWFGVELRADRKKEPEWLEYLLE
ncbi:PilZ domain-containing protein [Nitrospira sp. BLG_1]|uniref:PilZ domain-containing protein n=1 Tax=Nitrospira sp. BLG_1 TaxID=3395883 RepID=UPI0039BC6918